MKSSLRRALDAWRNADDVLQVSRGQWVAATLDVAVALKAARDYCGGDDRAFGIWLVENGCDDFGHQDRAALINIGEHIEVARKVLSETTSQSVRLIWEDEVKPRLLTFTSAGKGTPGAESTQQPPENNAMTFKNEEAAQNNATNVEAQLPEQVEPVAAAPKAPKAAATFAPKPSSVGRPAAYLKMPRGAEIAALFKNDGGRKRLSAIANSRMARQQWQLLLKAADTGLLTTNDSAPKSATIRMLFPQAPVGWSKQFSLDDPKARGIIEKMLLPAMIACKDQLLADPERTPQIIAAYENAQRANRQAEKRQQVVTAAVAALGPNQQELKVFGTTVWPRLDNRQGNYDYDQVRAAIWAFRDYLNWNVLMTRDNDPASHGIRIRNSTRYFREYLTRADQNSPMRPVFNLIIWFSYLWANSPTGECKWPAYPHIEGQW
jgi:hypothetical protein